METEPLVLSVDEVHQMLDNQEKEMDEFLFKEVLVNKPSTSGRSQIQNHDQSNQVCLKYFLKKITIRKMISIDFKL